MNNVYFIILVPQKETSYTNLIERFPHQSSRGHSYIFILYDYDNKTVISELQKILN